MNRVHGAAWRLLWAPLAAVLLSSAAWSADAGDAQRGNPGSAVAMQNLAGSTLAELRRHLDANALTELRTTRNGNYGASLLFYPDKLTYYVTLFRGQDFWRVIRTDVVADAENVYRTFAHQSEQLAQVDIDTIRLEAGTKYTKHLLSINKERLDALQQDFQRERQQADQVAQAQKQGKQHAIALTSNLQSTSSELTALRERIRQLEAQQVNPELHLPATPQTSHPVDAADTTDVAARGTARH